VAGGMASAGAGGDAERWQGDSVMMLDCTYASVKKMVRKVCKSRAAIAVEKALPSLGQDIGAQALVEAIAGRPRHDAVRRCPRSARPSRPPRLATGAGVLAVLPAPLPASHPLPAPAPLPGPFHVFVAQLCAQTRRVQCGEQRFACRMAVASGLMRCRMVLRRHDAGAMQVGGDRPRDIQRGTPPPATPPRAPVRL
jgi:hypothetical protein